MNKEKQKLIPRPRDYERFRDPIETILREAKKPLTWTEIKETAGFQQKVPNNKCVIAALTVFPGLIFGYNPFLDV